MQDKTGKLGKTPGSSDAAEQEPPAKPSPTALARGVSKPSLLGSILGRPVSTEEMLLRSEVARLQQLLTITTEAMEALAACFEPHPHRNGYLVLTVKAKRALRGASAALAKARGEKPESTSTEPDEGAQAGTRSQDS